MTVGPVDLVVREVIIAIEVLVAFVAIIVIVFVLLVAFHCFLGLEAQITVFVSALDPYLFHEGRHDGQCGQRWCLGTGVSVREQWAVSSTKSRLDSNESEGG